MLVKEIMNTRFNVLHPRLPISQAIDLFLQASLKEKRRVFGMAVVEDGLIKGMLSMYDILLFVRPKHVGVWGQMENIVPEEALDAQLNRLKDVYVSDLMTTRIISITPETHLLAALDIMLKKHVRRLPVVEKDNLVGMLYISDLFYCLLNKFLKNKEIELYGIDT